MNNNTKGFIYCLYNPSFKNYGKNVYKLGKTKNLASRLANYTTGYIDKSEYIITSIQLNNKHVAENILFEELKSYRINIKREFFDCDIKIIKEAFQKVEKISNESNISDQEIIKAKEEIIKANKEIIKAQEEIIKTHLNKPAIIIGNLHHCKICNKTYKSYQTLWIHNNSFHPNNYISDKIRDFQCKKCDKKFTRKNNMVLHMKTKCKKMNELTEKDKLKKELIELKKENEKLKESKSTTTINGNINDSL
jgi:hypothetical protein